MSRRERKYLLKWPSHSCLQSTRRGEQYLPTHHDAHGRVQVRSIGRGWLRGWKSSRVGQGPLHQTSLRLAEEPLRPSEDMIDKSSCSCCHSFSEFPLYWFYKHWYILNKDTEVLSFSGLFQTHWVSHPLFLCIHIPLAVPSERGRVSTGSVSSPTSNPLSSPSCQIKRLYHIRSGVLCYPLADSYIICTLNWLYSWHVWFTHTPWLLPIYIVTDTRNLHPKPCE